jgi:hypothetical protein
MAYIFINKSVYYNNKKPINKFIDEQDITKITVYKNSDTFGCVEIKVQFLSDFEKFVEYMFRMLGKDEIAYVGIRIGYFQDLKEMNVMIPEVYEKIWIESDRRGSCTMVCANASDYKLIGLLNKYDKVIIDLTAFGGDSNDFYQHCVNILSNVFISYTYDE